MIPLPEGVILDILTGKRGEMTINADEILTYDEPGEYTLLANSAVVHPEHPELVGRILEKIMDHWYHWYPERRIKRIYAQTISQSGRLMARKLYLGPLYTLEDGELRRCRDAYVLDMDEEPASRVISKFQERLHTKV